MTVMKNSKMIMMMIMMMSEKKLTKAAKNVLLATSAQSEILVIPQVLTYVRPVNKETPQCS